MNMRATFPGRGRRGSMTPGDLFLTEERWMPLTRYDMRNPSSPSYDDAMEVRICRTFWGRLQGAVWLLFTNW